jgi:hypothetical protein
VLAALVSANLAIRRGLLARVASLERRGGYDT